MTKTVNKFATLGELNKEIASIKVAGKKLDQRIQDAGVSALFHFEQHKDNGIINRLYDALPNGARKSAFTSWLLTYGALEANTDRATKGEQPFVYSRDKLTYPESADADPWFNHKPDPAPDAVLDLQKAIKAILAKAGKAESLKNGNADTLRKMAELVGISSTDVTSKFDATEEETAE